MQNIELQRGQDGSLNLFVAGHAAIGAKVSGVSEFDGKLTAVVLIPLKNLTVVERDNVVPFKPREPIPTSFVGQPVPPLTTRD